MHTDAASALAMLGLALVLDLLVGEYPTPLHPVVWMGKAIAAGLRLAPASGWWRQFLFGSLLTTLVVGASAALAWLVIWSLEPYPLLAILAGAALLKASFSLRALGRAALLVVRDLEQNDIPRARADLAALCSRAACDLDPQELLAATTESLAENASDSFVAPLFYYLLLGVPGAIGYRAINTLDAMIGYRGKHEALGKFAARLDDVVNFIPARLTALLLLLTGGFFGGAPRRGWRIMRRDGAKTPSPNGGRPMAAMAGLLGVRLEKKGTYALGDPDEALTCALVHRAWRMVFVSGVGWAFVTVLVVSLTNTWRSSS